MLLQKPAFLLFYHARAAEASFGEWLGVLWHGLSLDCTVAGYVTAFPVLVARHRSGFPFRSGCGGSF